MSHKLHLTTSYEHAALGWATGYFFLKREIKGNSCFWSDCWFFEGIKKYVMGKVGWSLSSYFLQNVLMLFFVCLPYWEVRCRFSWGAFDSSRRVSLSTSFRNRSAVEVDDDECRYDRTIHSRTSRDIECAEKVIFATESLWIILSLCWPDCVSPCMRSPMSSSRFSSWDILSKSVNISRYSNRIMKRLLGRAKLEGNETPGVSPLEIH